MNSRPGSPSLVSTLPAWTLIGVTRRDTACSSFFVHSLKRGIVASVLSIDARAIVTPGSSDGISQHTRTTRVKIVSPNLGCLRRAPWGCSTIRDVSKGAGHGEYGRDGVLENRRGRSGP